MEYQPAVPVVASVRTVRTVRARWRTATLLALLVSACQPLISPYDHAAYQNATSLKAQVLALVDRAGGAFQAHEQRVEAVLLELDKAYEYAYGLEANRITARQWEILKDPGRDLVGGFVRTWRAQGTLSQAYITSKKRQLAQAFDYIICLEANKREAAACAKAGSR